MRLIAASLAALTASLCLGTVARAGLFELPDDPITRYRPCDSVPCRDNNLTYKHIWRRDRYLRFDIHGVPARYRVRRERVMVSPPGVEVTGWRNSDDWFARDDLVELPNGGTRQVRRPTYAWVKQLVLVRPAINWVTRRHPYYAYYPDQIVVVDPDAR